MDQSNLNGEVGYVNLKGQVVPIPIGSSFYNLDSCKRTKNIAGKYFFTRPRVCSSTYEALAQFLLMNNLKLDQVSVDDQTKKQVHRQLSRRVKHKVLKECPDLGSQHAELEQQLEPFNFKCMDLYGRVVGIINGNTVKAIFNIPLKTLCRWHMHPEKDGTVSKRYVAVPYGDRNAGIIVEHNVKIFGIKTETRESKKGKAQIEVLKSVIHDNGYWICAHMLGYTQGGFVRAQIYFLNRNDDGTDSKIHLTDELLDINHPKFNPLFESSFSESGGQLGYESVKQVKGRFYGFKEVKKNVEYGTQVGLHVAPVQSVEYDEDSTKSLKKRDQKAVKAVQKVNKKNAKIQKKNAKKQKKKPDATMIPLAGVPDNAFVNPLLTVNKDQFGLGVQNQEQTDQADNGSSGSWTKTSKYLQLRQVQINTRWE